MKKYLLLVPIFFSVLANSVSAVSPADFGLKEGDVISASDSSDPDVYIVNEWGYKRLFVNPEIFNLYGHLGWNKIKKVSVTTRDAFTTSGLFRNCEALDERVFGLDVVNEDVANLRWVNTTGTQAVADDSDFFKKVFCINTKETKLYGSGAQYSSVLQIPKYSRGGITTPTSTGLRIDLVAPNKILSGYSTTITITGSGFKQGMKFDFGSGNIQPACSVSSDTKASCIVPASMPALSFNLSVTNPDGHIANFNNALTVQVAPTQISGLTDTQIFSKVAPSTALIFTGNFTGAGTGIIISDDGYILTNEHVVSSYTTVDVFLTDDGYFKQPYKQYTGTVLGKDSVNDLAIVKITASGLKTIEFGSSSNTALTIGSPVYALGFPLIFNVGASSVKFLSGKVVGTTNSNQYLQIDVPIQPGNSGGPLVNSNGQLVGVNNLCLTLVKSFCSLLGQAFAIAIDYATPLIPGLKSGSPIPTWSPTPNPSPTPTPTPSPTPTPTPIGPAVIYSAVSGATPSQKIVIANTTVPVLSIDFTAENYDFTIDRLDIAIVNSGAEAAVANVVLKDGSTVLGTLPLNGTTASFTGLNVLILKNTSKSITLELQLAEVGAGAAATNFDVKTSMTGFRARDSEGVITNDTNVRTGNSFYVRKSYPSVSAVSLPTTVLSDGEQSVSKFTLSANGNTVGVKKFVWTFTKSLAATIADSSQSDFKLLEDGVNIQSSGTFTISGSGETNGTITFTFSIEKQITTNAAKTYELKLNLGHTAANTSFVTQLKVNSSTFINSDSFSNIDTTSAKLIWSDRSASLHSESTADWFNDNLVNSSVSQSVVR